jgi:hypothetical protein
MLSTEQVISKVEAAYHIKASTRNADGCECAVHSKTVEMRLCCLGRVRITAEGEPQRNTDLMHSRRA